MKVDKQIEDYTTRKGKDLSMEKITNAMLDGTPYLMVSAPRQTGPHDTEAIGICTASGPEEMVGITMTLVELMDGPGPFEDIIMAAVTIRTARILSKTIKK